jgi:ubiquinone/menaquinone biosynthesis C-methylase UbiE
MGSSNLDPEKQRLSAAFDRIARQYEGLRFVHVCARRLLELAGLEVGMRVLDVGTGTGLVALAAAGIVGERGSVVGVDFSPQMLHEAEKRLEVSGLQNVTFLEGDAEGLELPDGSFDVVLCASALFFVPDMTRATQEFHRVLKPGGKAGFTGFGAGFLSPLTELLSARLEVHGIPAAKPPVGRLANPETCQKLLENAGFTQIEVSSDQLGYHHSSFESRWAEISAGLEGMPLSKLSPEDLERAKAEHGAELEPLFTSNGLWTNVLTNFAFGTK